VTDSILLSVLLLLPALSIWSIRCYCWLNYSSFLRQSGSILHKVLWVIVVMGIDLIRLDVPLVAPHGLWIDSTRWLLASDLRRYLSFSFTGYYLSFFNPCRSNNQCSSLRFVNAVDAVLAIDPAWCGNSSILMTSFFLSLPPSKTLLSFLLPLIQLSFFVVLLLCFDPYPYGLLLYYSCCLVVVDIDSLFLYYVDIQEGFSIRVGCSTNCTQYLFRDHFFLAKYCFEYCFSSPLLLSISMLLSTLLALSSILVATLLMLVIL